MFEIVCASQGNWSNMVDIVALKLSIAHGAPVILPGGHGLSAGDGHSFSRDELAEFLCEARDCLTEVLEARESRFDDQRGTRQTFCVSRHADHNECAYFERYP